MTNGMAYSIETTCILKEDLNAPGKEIINLFPKFQGLSVAAILPLKHSAEKPNQVQIVFATSEGKVRKSRLSDFSRSMSNGIKAMSLSKVSTLVNARICTDKDDIILMTAKGYAARFPSNTIRVSENRESVGVKGIQLRKGDRVVAMEVVPHFATSLPERDEYFKRRNAALQTEGVLSKERYKEMENAEVTLLTISDNGLGNRSSSHEYSVSKNRGTKGNVARKLRDCGNDAKIVGFLSVCGHDQVMLTTSSGRSIWCNVSRIPFQSRKDQDFPVTKLEPNERIVSVAHMEDTECNDRFKDSST